MFAWQVFRPPRMAGLACFPGSPGWECVQCPCAGRKGSWQSGNRGSFQLVTTCANLSDHSVSRPSTRTSKILTYWLPCALSPSMRKLMVVRRLKWPKGKSESDILDIFETFCFLKQCLLVSSFFPMCHCSISRSKATSHDTSRMSRCWFWNNQAAQPVPSKIHL